MTSQRQIAANKRNAARSSGPRTQQGKARSRMNALRHGLSAALIETTTVSPNGDNLKTTTEDKLIATHRRFRQIEIERVKIMTEFGKSSSSLAEALCIAVKRVAALERYSRQGYSELKKRIAAPD